MSESYKMLVGSPHQRDEHTSTCETELSKAAAFHPCSGAHAVGNTYTLSSWTSEQNAKYQRITRKLLPGVPKYFQVPHQNKGGES